MKGELIKYLFVLAAIVVFSSCALPVPDLNRYQSDTLALQLPETSAAIKDSLVGEHDMLIHIIGNSDSLKVKCGTGKAQYIDLTAADSLLTAWRQRDSSGSVLLSSSKNTQYKKVVELTDKLQQNKIHRFVLITEMK